MLRLVEPTAMVAGPGEEIMEEVHDPAKDAAAIDGDPTTRWCANGPDAPQWWQVDLGKREDLSGIRILWEQDGVEYKYKIEGSDDGKTWIMLSDQTKSAARDQDRHYHYYRNNLWCLNSARAEVDAAHLYVLTLWDEDRAEEGGEGTADFVARARRYASRYENINPTSLELGSATAPAPTVSISRI